MLWCQMFDTDHARLSRIAGFSSVTQLQGITQRSEQLHIRNSGVGEASD